MIIISAIAVLSFSVNLKAQKFSVSGFRILTNDVTAFIRPVSDLNNEDCALIKVPASEDFVFSTPLGIVKREDKIGEIWLFIPRKSKKITIKHPEWGVLRDYQFPIKIDSHVTYELKLEEPSSVPIFAKVAPEPVLVRDTIILTHTDTLIIKPIKERISLSSNFLVTLSFGGNSKTFAGGLLMTVMKRYGAFLHLSSDFGNFSKTLGQCDRYGNVNGVLPYYSGEKRHSFFIVNTGAVQRINAGIKIFEGLGFGNNKISWQLAESEGGGYLKNSFYSVKGLSFEIGMICNIKRVSISASVMSIRAKQWYGSLGIGINIGKLQK